MAQNAGLLVDVDIEPVSGAGGSGNNGVASPLTLGEKGGGGPSAGEVNSNNAAHNNVFDAIDTIQTYQTSVEASGSGVVGSKYRVRNNSVDSTNSIRSYDSTGETCAPHRDAHHDLDMFQEWSQLTQARPCCLTWPAPARPLGLGARGRGTSEAGAVRTRLLSEARAARADTGASTRTWTTRLSTTGRVSSL